MSDRVKFFFFGLVFLFSKIGLAYDEWPVVESVDRQPLLASVARVAMALESVGRPLTSAQQDSISVIGQLSDDAKVVSAIQELLDPACLAAIHINAESRVKVIEGPVPKSLVQNGWRTFLVKVHNEAGVNPALQCTSPQAKPQFVQSDSSAKPGKQITMADVKDRWLDIALPTRQPMKSTLSGLSLEYRILQLHSRDVGQREATLSFSIGQGTQDLGFRNDVAILFGCQPGHKVAIDVRDKESKDELEKMMVALEIRDELGRVYPNPARRLAPDFFFHNQIYRQRGESISLPEGKFDVRISRGPEYLPRHQQLVVSADEKPVLRADLERWIDPTNWNWYSGDHHIHAAGCAHYQNPTEGVGPDDMMRHVLGEDLKVGCVLSWGPCWYTQKKFFEGKPSTLSTPNYLMRYDVEVSGFPSSHAGHLCLLRLSEDDYPGTNRLEQWPSWTLPILEWGKRQGGVVGYSHSGFGLSLPDYLPNGKRGTGGRAADTLPDYAMPRFDGIGANEFIVTVAHDACDFISSVDTPSIWELNIWYHTLNCGFRSRISGETDFPCIYGDRVGLGRVYVQLNPDEKLDFDAWVDGLKNGRSYCGDGLSHVLKFGATPIHENEIDSNVETVRLGWPGSDGVVSQLSLDRPGKVQFDTSIAAFLEPEPTMQAKAIRDRRLDMKPYWHIERCRIDNTRKVEAELIINGQSVESKEVLADGSVQNIRWLAELDESSWVAVRILPSVHTNPIFIEVEKKPIRASVKSAEWCRRAVDVCWNSKQGQIREPEKAAAKKAYDRAAEIYDNIIIESSKDKSSTRFGTQLLNEQAIALMPVVKSSLGRSFLQAAKDLPKIEDREILCDQNNSRNAITLSASKQLKTDELANFKLKTFDEHYYYFTRYGSPLAFVRPLELVSYHTGLESVEGKRIVDFGFGSVGHLRMLASLGADVTGIEVDRLLKTLYSEPSDTGVIPVHSSANVVLPKQPGRLELLFGKFPTQLHSQVRGGVDFFISKNTLKRGYIHPEHPVDPKRLVQLDSTDEQFLNHVYEKLNADGYLLIYNLHPAPAAEGKPYIPWADGRSPFSREAFMKAGFEVVSFDEDDTRAAHEMAKTLKWDAQMDLENDLFATYTLAKKPANKEE